MVTQRQPSPGRTIILPPDLTDEQRREWTKILVYLQMSNHKEIIQ